MQRILSLWFLLLVVAPVHAAAPVHAVVVVVVVHCVGLFFWSPIFVGYVIAFHVVVVFPKFVVIVAVVSSASVLLVIVS